MKQIILIFGIAGMATLISCGGAETKVDTEDTLRKNDTVQKTDTTQAVQDLPKEKVPEVNPARDSPIKKSVTNNTNEILANIDKHLVCTIQPSGTTGNLVVANTLGDITFEKAMVEVNELNDDGSKRTAEFYTVINLDPGTSKSVMLKVYNPSAKMATHIVKAKSDQLTNGEMILVGSRYAAR